MAAPPTRPASKGPPQETPGAGQVRLAGSLSLCTRPAPGGGAVPRGAGGSGAGVVVKRLVGMLLVVVVLLAGVAGCGQNDAEKGIHSAKDRPKAEGS